MFHKPAYVLGAGFDPYLYGCGFCGYGSRLDFMYPCHTCVPPYPGEFILVGLEVQVIKTKMPNSVGDIRFAEGRQQGSISEYSVSCSSTEVSK